MPDDANESLFEEDEDAGSDDEEIDDSDLEESLFEEDEESDDEEIDDSDLEEGLFEEDEEAGSEDDSDLEKLPDDAKDEAPVLDVDGEDQDSLKGRETQEESIIERLIREMQIEENMNYFESDFDLDLDE